MTDNEIIKALECSRLHSNLADGIMSGEITENKVSELTDQEKLLVQSAWDCIQPFEVRDIVAQQQETINRQKEQIEGLVSGQETLQKYISEKDAEIERLTEENKKVSAYIGNGWGYVSFLEFVKNQRTEAVKECLDKIEQMDVSESDNYIMVKKIEFDNLVKEMVGEE